MEKVIEKERPDGILLAFGGQTALNCGTELYSSESSRNTGASVRYFGGGNNDHGRSRLVREKLDEIDAKTPVSRAVSGLEDALLAAREIGFPVMVRSAYALGGQGSGICEDEKEFIELCKSALSFSDQILVEESLKAGKKLNSK